MSEKNEVKTGLFGFVTLIPFVGFFFAIIFSRIYFETVKSLGIELNLFIIFTVICLSLIPIVASTWVKFNIFKNLNKIIKLSIALLITILAYLFLIWFDIDYLKHSLLPIIFLVILNSLFAQIDFSKFEKKGYQALILLVFLTTFSDRI